MASGRAAHAESSRGISLGLSSPSEIHYDDRIHVLHVERADQPDRDSALMPEITGKANDPNIRYAASIPADCRVLIGRLRRTVVDSDDREVVPVKFR